MSFEELSQNVGKKNAERAQVVRDDKLTNRPKVSSSGDPHSLFRYVDKDIAEQEELFRYNRRSRVF